MTTSRERQVCATLAAIPDDPTVWTDSDLVSFRSAHQVASEQVRRVEKRTEWQARTTNDTGPGARQKPAKALPRSKPKPAELVASERIVRERSGGDCEARTAACEGRATQAHHIAGRSNHAPDALLDVCGQGNLTGCHGYIHQHPDESYAAGWMRKRNGETSRPEYQWARP